MKLSLEIVNEKSACLAGVEWYKNHKQPQTVESCIKKLFADKKCGDRYNWSNWLLSEMLSPDNKIRYAIFAAEQVIGIFEKQYPNDPRPRKAIEAAKEYLKLKTSAARAAAGDAAWAAAGDAAYKDMLKKIIKYGLTLIKEGL
jgi:hypothetical protein